MARAWRWAAIDGVGFCKMWQWLHDLSSAQATVVGTLIGSLVGLVLGFITLVGGALFNERLNRRRDDRNADLNRSRDERLRREEQRAWPPH
jgi:hypothetical protein